MAKGLKDELRQRLSHQSRNAMGIDVADLNGDGQPEIMVVDMLPDDNLRRKTMFGDIPHQGKRVEHERGYANQYVRNTLQFNHGGGNFSDVAFQAGVAATDWSWTPLLADFDNDGRRDIFVSNGYPKDITNRDFSDFGENSDQFGTRTAQKNRVIESLAKLEGVHQPNFFFRNEGDLSFNKVNWLPDEPTYTNGSVFVDLDRDGDLDLVTNNINEPAGLFRNHTRERQPDSSNYLQVLLTGPAGNPHALGTKVWVEYADKQAYHEHYRQRGYLSTVDQLIHFGLGGVAEIDRITIKFPIHLCNNHSNLWYPRRRFQPAAPFIGRRSTPILTTSTSPFATTAATGPRSLRLTWTETATTNWYSVVEPGSPSVSGVRKTMGNNSPARPV